MPILIQDFASGHYLSADGRWTKQISKALQFEQVLRAWDEIDERMLSGVRIVVCPDNEPVKVLAGVTDSDAVAFA
jgi:hypothetical protein